MAIDLTKIPLSPVVEANGLLFLSGQLGFKEPGALVKGGIAEQTRQVFSNIEKILSLHGAGLTDIVKTTVWLTDKQTFQEFNTVYGTYFDQGAYPARSTVVSGLLIEGALIEIEVFARKPHSA